MGRRFWCALANTPTTEREGLGEGGIAVHVAVDLLQVSGGVAAE